MAEFCLECWNELNGTEDSEKKYICHFECQNGEKHREIAISR